MVASMTESELDAQSETISHRIIDCLRQHSEVGMVFAG
jgi:hypothetical protein